MPAVSARHEEAYELGADGAHEPLDFDHGSPFDDDFQSHLLTGERVSPGYLSALSSVLAALLPFARNRNRASRRSRKIGLPRSRGCTRRSLTRHLAFLASSVLGLTAVLVLVTAVVFPSYTRLPDHYAGLRERVRQSQKSGRGNVEQQKIFIAASLYDQDGQLAGGPWADNVLELIHLLGPEHVYLSIYENDSGPAGRAALARLEERVTCDHTLAFDEHLSLDEVPHVKLPDGSERIKRIAYLAEVRNRALRPLETSTVRYDKLLYLNDVVFHPVDVLQLLFSTNIDASGAASYRAACAVDFINPFKFYDTFATRDLEGYSMGVPFFPWFSTAGGAGSYTDLIRGKDAVQVRSCWGGMVAFDAKYFQAPVDPFATAPTAADQSPSNLTAPYRFRAEEDLYWDASECCLIHADIQSLDTGATGIYMNPFVRVAYDPWTLSWLGVTRRFERLYSPVHFLVDLLAGMPRFNPRRAETPGEQVVEIVWVPDAAAPKRGSFQSVARIANHAAFCGRRNLQVMKNNPQPGERPYEMIPIP